MKEAPGRSRTFLGVVNVLKQGRFRSLGKVMRSFCAISVLLWLLHLTDSSLYSFFLPLYVFNLTQQEGFASSFTAIFVIFSQELVEIIFIFTLPNKFISFTIILCSV